ncbi:hypothetical protein C3941_07840 [Kaistia algarum]|uniref:glycosyltransferase family 39 protein n=1 Tax=Kaistia algarum TaxID=2083279 RepID=UPI000CE7B451|nr:glycosyltransferase family 39 protein [Kaistia algarum]MCX5511967.1 glycosyltransferase family 39 protein [Kaistia algarum]PPE80098.1 hypothetical protein C3941_07840 [Kaistia algarum]
MTDAPGRRAAEDAEFARPGGALARLFEERPALFLMLLIFGQMLLWTALPALFFHSLPLDVLENVGWSRDLQWGYYKHPPLQVWASAAALALPGHAIWPLYLLGPIASALTFVAIYKLGCEIADRHAGLLAALLFSLVFYANFAVTEFNANVVQLPIWAFAAYALWRGLTRPGLIAWAALGILLALGVYAKYSSIVLVASLIVAALVLPEGRQALRRPGPYLGALIALALALPNLLWLRDVDYLPLRYAAGRSEALTLLGRISNPAGFLLTQLADCAGALLMIWAGLGLRHWRSNGEGVDFAASPTGLRYGLAIALAPLAITAAIPLLAGSGIKDMWGGPMLIWLPLATVLTLKPVYERRRLSWMLAAWLAIFVGAPVIAAAISAGGPHVGIQPQRTSLPGPELADGLMAAWRSTTPAPLRIVAGDTWESGLVSAYSPDRPSVFVGGATLLNPWIDGARIDREGLLVVWPESPNGMPAQYRTLGPFAAEGVVTERVPGTSGKELRFGWAARLPRP